LAKITTRKKKETVAGSGIRMMDFPMVVRILSNSSSENNESLLAMKTYSNPKNYHAQNP